MEKQNFQPHGCFGQSGALVCLLPDHHFDTIGQTRLIANSHFGALIADQAFDWMESFIEGMNIRPCTNPVWVMGSFTAGMKKRKANIVISQRQ